MNTNPASLELETDRRFQERFWVFQRIGWVAMLLLVAAALAGLAGTSGAASSGRVEAGGATIDYPRIARWQTADTMTIEFSGSGLAQVRLPAAFADAFSIENVTPQPAKVVATPDGPLFEFDLGGGEGPKKVNFAVRADRPSLPRRARGEVAGEPYEFSFTVLP